LIFSFQFSSADIFGFAEPIFLSTLAWFSSPFSLFRHFAPILMMNIFVQAFIAAIYWWRHSSPIRFLVALYFRYLVIVPESSLLHISRYFIFIFHSWQNIKYSISSLQPFFIIFTDIAFRISIFISL
jgi:hypothetical protein